MQDFVSVGIRPSAGAIELEDSWERSPGSLRRILPEQFTAQPTAFIGTVVPQLLYPRRWRHGILINR